MKVKNLLIAGMLFLLAGCSPFTSKPGQPGRQIDPAAIARMCLVLESQQGVIEQIVNLYVTTPEDRRKVEIAMLTAKAALGLCVALTMPLPQ